MNGLILLGTGALPTLFQSVPVQISILCKKHVDIYKKMLPETDTDLIKT